MDLGPAPVNLGGGELFRPYAETYNNGQWVADSNSSNGQFVLQPASTNDAGLQSVYCITAQYCEAIGQWYSNGDSQVNPWGAQLSSSGWALQSTPPNGADAGFSGGESLTCPSECWALGNYVNNGTLQLFADELSGPTLPAPPGALPEQWGFATLPNPGGADPGLEAISCGAINYC